MARTEYYDDPDAPEPNSLVVAYSDGEVRRQFNVCFTARVTGGELAISDESTELRFVDPRELKSLPMHHTQRLRLRHFLQQRSAPYLR
ncbi:NUDIX hydrolase [Streptomyces similanensis]|uniref:NUDIX hydrolase n=1 Tax=Streptomyces similanensis TaxID=1274988 RepID=A0ABP9JVE3_9ACTN